MIKNFKQLVITVFIAVSSLNNSYSQSVAISVGFVSATPSSGKIHIIVIKPDEIKASQFIYYKADNVSNTYKEIERSSSTSFTDKNVDIDKQAYCYKVSYIDDAGNQSEMSQPFCSVYLSAGGLNSIKWTPFSELQNAEPVEYFIDIVNEDGSINRLTSYKTTELSANILEIDGVEQEIDSYGKAKIRVRAIQRTSFKLNNVSFINHPIEVYSNVFTFIPPPTIYLPTAFSPNGDGTNDEFVATGKGIVDFEMTISDRWGNTVFESKDINEGWKGVQIDQSTPSLVGNYVYKVKAKDKYDKIIEKTGMISLIK